MSSKYLVDKCGVVWERVIRPGFDDAYVALKTEKGDPFYKNLRKKIPIDLVREVHSFFMWTQEEYKSEAVCHLFYSPELGWKAWAFPQKICHGLSAKVLDITATEQYRQFAPYDEAGTWHHHCNIGAHQSGTDKSDESGRPGIHLTTGHIDSKYFSIHARVMYAANGGRWFYGNFNLSDWFEIPEEYENHIKDLETLGFNVLGLREQAVDSALRTPPDKAHPFPEQWKDNMQREVISGQHSIPFNIGKDHGHWYHWDGDGFHGESAGSCHHGQNNKTPNVTLFKASMQYDINAMHEFAASDVADCWEIVKKVCESLNKACIHPESKMAEEVIYELVEEEEKKLQFEDAKTAALDQTSQEASGETGDEAMERLARQYYGCV